MNARASTPYTAIVGTALAALLLAIYPLPGWLAPARPDWLGLFVIHWVMRAPLHAGMMTAWCLGLLFDGITGGLLGPHALALTVVAYIAMIMRPRMLHYALTQQTIVVALLCGGGPFLAHWARGIATHAGGDLWFLAGGLTSAACWPIVSMRNGYGRHMDNWDRVA